jgi:flavin reductase (DIM6/NTAB) family NADH-FMN oxidoreductase RutF
MATTIALLTSEGRHGKNVMSAEWTFQISYRPMRLIVLVNPRDATYDNIIDSKEFGANFLSSEQASLASIAGSYTGKEVNKLSCDLFQTYPAEKIQPPMLLDCFVNAECRVSQRLETGDHVMFIGDVVVVKFDPGKRPLLYRQRRFLHMGEIVDRKPLVYLTSTVRNGSVRLDGRLSGVKTYPQTVSLTISPLNSSPILEANVETDAYDYFELVPKLGNSLPKGKYSASANWNSLKGLAFAVVG